MYNNSTKPYVFSSVRIIGSTFQFTLQEVWPSENGLFSPTWNTYYRSDISPNNGFLNIMQGNAYKWQSPPIGPPPGKTYKAGERDTDSAQTVVSWGPSSGAIADTKNNLNPFYEFAPPSIRMPDRSQLFGLWIQPDPKQVYWKVNVPSSLNINGNMLHVIGIYTDIRIGETAVLSDPDNPSPCSNDRPTILGVWDASYNTTEKMWIWKNVNKEMFYDPTVTYQQQVGDTNTLSDSIPDFCRVRTKLQQQTGGKYTIRHRNKTAFFAGDSGFDVFKLPVLP